MKIDGTKIKARTQLRALFRRERQQIGGNVKVRERALVDDARVRLELPNIRVRDDDAVALLVVSARRV